MGFKDPTPVQESCIPLILKGRDVLGSAQTGTGKTAAFVIPVLDKILQNKKNKKDGIRALVITPTRELASQVDEVFFALGYHTGLTTAKVYGGDDWGRQEKALSKGTNIVVATPGRLLDHMKIHTVDFSNLDFLILDEADRMLDMGFIPDITQIVNKLPKKRQTLLFSATLPDSIIQLAKKMMHKPERVSLASPNKAAKGVSQGMYYVEERDKLPLVLHLYEKEKWQSAIIFMSTKRGVDKLSRELHKKGASVTSIHGDRVQAEREKALESFRKGEFRVIIATDVMSRGIDIYGVSHIINFNVPHDVEDYVHRIGRTARVDATGDAITLVSGQDRRYMEQIIRKMESKITKLEVPEGIIDDKKTDPATRRTKTTKPRRKSTQKPAVKKRASAPAGEPQADQKEKEKKAGATTQRKPARKRSAKAGDDKAPSKGSPSKKKSERGEKKPAPSRKPSRQGTAKSKPPDKRKQKGKGPRSAKSKVAGQRKKTSAKSTTKDKKQLTPEERKREKLFKNITSPNMKKVDKAVGKKDGFWNKVKGLFGKNE